jgi:hypothetical protein
MAARAARALAAAGDGFLRRRFVRKPDIHSSILIHGTARLRLSPSLALSRAPRSQNYIYIETLYLHSEQLLYTEYALWERKILGTKNSVKKFAEFFVPRIFRSQNFSFAEFFVRRIIRWCWAGGGGGLLLIVLPSMRTNPQIKTDP